MTLVPAMLPVLLRIARAQAVKRPLQSALLVLGVALGVAVVVAVDLANRSALVAFERSTEAVAGRASHRVVGDGRRLAEDLYPRLRRDLGLREAAPVVEGQVRVGGEAGEALTLLGVDPFAEAPFRSYLGGEAEGAPGDGSLGPFLTEPGAILIGEDLAARLGVAAGGPLPLWYDGRRPVARVIGLLRPADALSRRALDALVLADIGTAQAIFGRAGLLDRIDLRLTHEPAARRSALAALRAVLPPGAEVEEAGAGGQALAGMTEAFRLNLTALSLLALLVAVFLIFNSLRFSVVQRRPSLAVLRALGLTPGEVGALLLLEAGLLGLAGGLLGLGLGVVMGRGAVQVVTRTIQDLYFSVTVRQVEVQAAPLLWGLAVGVLASLAGALAPALEAARVPPVTSLRRSEAESVSRAAAPRLALLGLGVGLAGLALLAWPGQERSIQLGFGGMALLLLGYALWSPVVTLGLMRLVGPPLAGLLGLPGRLAPRNVARALSRTSVAIGALMVAVCVSIGVSLMVSSFRRTVELWLEQTLQADIFLSSPGLSASNVGRPLDAGLAEALAGLPGVAGLATAQGVKLRAEGVGVVDVVVLSQDLAGDGRAYLEAPAGGAAAVWRALEAGELTVSEPLARRLDLGVGSRLRLATDDGPRDFAVAGVFYDYGNERGVVFMADPVYRRHWRDRGVSSIALRLAGGQDAEAYAAALRTALARAAGGASAGPAPNGSGTPELALPAGVIEPGRALDVRSNRGLREGALEVFDRAFAITAALRLLAIVVAFIGVLAAIAALQISRAREFGTLRAMGMTAGQLGRLSLVESGLVGLTAGLMSWPAGLGLALLLIYVINRRSFGWTILLQPAPGPFALALAIALGAALLAGLYGALRLRALPIARVLREE